MTTQNTEQNTEQPVEETRVNLRLIPPAKTAVDAAMRRDGHNRTDVLNRAVVVYNMLGERRANGWTLLLRHEETDRTVEVEFL